MTGADHGSGARYGALAIGLHWAMALLVIAALGVGTWMTDLAASPFKVMVYAWHKSVGLAVLALAVLRLAWRASRRAPPLPASMPRWQRWAAHGGHGALYLMLFALPVTGWLQNSAAGFPLSWFGLFKVPALVARDREAFAFWQQVHEAMAWTLLALVAIHVAAALKHHWIDRDGVLLRMLPRRRTRRRPEGAGS